MKHSKLFFFIACCILLLAACGDVKGEFKYKCRSSDMSDEVCECTYNILEKKYGSDWIQENLNGTGIISKAYSEDKNEQDEFIMTSLVTEFCIQIQN